MPFIFNPFSGTFDYYQSASGSSSNSFTIWQPPSGTSPTAASSTDTMHLTTSDSTITITGNSTTDTLDFKVTSGKFLPLTGGTLSGSVDYGNNNATNIATLLASDYFDKGGNQNYMSFFGGSTYWRGSWVWRDNITNDIGSASGRPRDYVGGGSVSWGYDRVVATNGGSHTVANHASSLILNPAGTIASFTATMPASPYDGQVLVISTSQTVTALTLSGNTGQTVNGALTTLTASAPAQYQYIATDTAWYRIG